MRGVLVIDTAGPVIGIAYGDAHHTEFFEQRAVRGSDGIIAAKLAEFDLSGGSLVSQKNCYME